MPMFDFRCCWGHVTEELTPADTVSIQCPKCGLAAAKVLLSPPKVSWLNLGSQRHASPEAIAKFDKMHRARKAKEDKAYADHGDYGPEAGS